MKKTIFFDLGNVILFFDHQKMYAQVAEFCGMDHANLFPHLQKFAEPYERGTIDSWAIYHELCSASGNPLNFAGLMHAMSDIFQPNTEMIELIKKLKSKQIPLYIL